MSMTTEYITEETSPTIIEPIVVEPARQIYDSLVDEQGKISYEVFKNWFDNYQPNSKKRTIMELMSPNEVRVATPAVNKPKAAKVTPSQTISTISLTNAKRKALLKSFIAGLKKSIKEKKFYVGGSREECASEVVMSPSEFEEIFGSHGTVPAETKPSNVVVIKNLHENEVKEIFGDLLEGITTQTFSQPRAFSKQYKTGSVPCTIGKANLHFSKNTSNCKIKFVVHAEGDEDSYSGGRTFSSLFGL